MKKINWSYANATNHRVGRMVCTACKGKITSGQFRYHETKEAYFSQHRACSEDDIKWSQLDAEKVEQSNHKIKLSHACINFKREWDIDDLDELIEALVKELKQD